MKLENCGRCGHEAVIKVGSVQPCPCCGNCPDGEYYPDFAEWDKAQRSIRTERINAASLAIDCSYIGICKDLPGVTHADSVDAAVNLIAAQDAAAQARFKEVAE